MSVLVTTPDLGETGGVAMYYAVLREYLGADVHFCIVGTRAGRETTLGKGVRLLRDYGRFYRAAKSGRYDLIHLNPSLGPKALLRDGLSLLLAKSLGRRVLVFLHGWDPACEAVIRRRFLPLFRRVYFRADAFIVLASQFRSALREFGCTKPIYLETMVVPDEIFSYAAGRPAPPVPRDRLNILFLSRLEKAKGIYEALEAWRILKKRYPALVMTVAGDGSERESAQRYVRSQNLKDVVFVGWVRAQSKLEAFANADLYLFPSHHEGMPQSVLEAMACGLPVVTRAVGGVRDFFEDGKMGFLTESEDPSVYAQLMGRLVLDTGRRQAIAHYNRLFARQHFAASAAAARLARIYQKTINSLGVASRGSI
jgi:glycosyltransferase involved in cell wall biosynthesis